jgi:hypothetical protein
VLSKDPEVQSTGFGGFSEALYREAVGLFVKIWSKGGRMGRVKEGAG